MLKPLQSKRISNVEKAVKVVRSAKAEKATVAVRGSVSNGDHIEHIIIHPKDSTEGKRSSWFVFDINGKLTGTAYPNLDSAVSDLRKKFSSTDQDETAIYFDEISV